ncbi:MAG: class II glutamine amidotransferase [Theionarchaea archaeon]|nr:class II glutamine amidotransferase [Theionarchaea archaeon]MBU7037880.1 class II glutamine amidotransferase [Theionarchaea archaeon]
MCRMLAFMGPPCSPEDLLTKFQRLALYGNSIDGVGHRDGWGIGYYSHGIVLTKKAECAAESTKYTEAALEAAQKAPHVLMAHLRKASPNTPVTDEEVHPFQIDHYLFCHNGSITQRDGQPLGKTLDSVLFFRKLRETSLIEAVAFFRDFKYTSLTCLLTDGVKIWAYRECTEREDYYTLYYCTRQDSVIVCSEPILDCRWVPVDNRQLITVLPDHSVLTEMLT